LIVFEFHGWVTVRVDDRDDPEMDVMRVREQHAIDVPTVELPWE